MTKIKKIDSSTDQWGEDVFSLIRSQGSSQITKSTIDAVERHYRLELRDKFQNDAKVNAALAESIDCLLSEASFDSIKDLVKDTIRLGTEEIFDQILHELLQELDGMNKAKPTAYLINRQDGKVLMPVSDKEIYTPSPYIGEDGVQRPAKPVLHPSISAQLTMYAYEKGRKNEAIEKAVEAGASIAVEHLVIGPEAILERARVLLRTQGVQVKTEIQGGKTEMIEVGREQVDEIHQSPNYSFHRSYMYGSILAKKVLDLLPKKKEESIVDLKFIELKKGSKEQWYNVTLDWVKI